jgi:hypothetical protein
MVDRQARKRIQAREERAVPRDRKMVELSARLSYGVGADFTWMAATVEAIRTSLRRQHPLSLRRRHPRSHLRTPASLPGSPQTFRRSLQSCAGSALRCCGAAAAMPSPSDFSPPHANSGTVRAVRQALPRSRCVDAP